MMTVATVLRRGAKMIKTRAAAKACTVILLAIALTGCATKLGRNFDSTFAQQIKPGETTKQEVLQKLGRPPLMRKSLDEETWTYAYYVGKTMLGYTITDMFTEYDPETMDQGSQKRLIVTFKGDIVKESKYAVELPRRGD
jgi:outer membrane protein assembly factor BamE (lipoprotein component of BamABCDE complex)